MTPTAIAFTVYPVENLARARRFYEEVLGLVATHAVGNEEQGFVEFDLGPHTLALGKIGLFQPGPAGGKVAIEVRDFEAAIARLRERGVTFVFEPTETPVCHMAGCHDSEGNIFIVHQRKPDLAGPAIKDQ